MKKTILVDQDNTLTDFNEATARYMGKLYGWKGRLEKEDVTEYNILRVMYPHLPDTKITEMFEELFNAPDYWASMKPISGCLETMEELYDRYEVFIVTKPWPTSKNCIPEKIEWTSKYLPFFDISRLIFCAHKHLLHGDIMIDDSPVYLASSNCEITIALKYPYNEEAEATYKVDNWQEIRELLL